MIKQRTDSDCYQCCLSELINIPYEEIPEFSKLYDGNRLYTEIDKFLYLHGYIRIVCDVTFENGVLNIPYFSGKCNCIGILEKQGRDYSHAVVLAFQDNNNITVYDPKNNSEYEFDDIAKIEIIIPMFN